MTVLSEPASESLHAIVKAARDHLRMDVAFVSPVSRNRSTDHVDAAESMSFGRRWQVPITLRDGQVYGDLRCLSIRADQPLSKQDLRTLEAFAAVAAHLIEVDLHHDHQVAEKRSRVAAALEPGQMVIVYQPIYNVDTGQIAAVECLTRFQILPHRTPDVWFIEAGEVGLGIELELRAIELALYELRALPGTFDIAVNVSSRTIMSDRLLPALSIVNPRRIILEITEHEHIENYACLQRFLEPLRLHGVQVTIDDAGAGYANMHHIINIRPERIKLDVSLTSGIDGDAIKRALAAALIEFARQTQTSIIAEGVETASEYDTLQALGVHTMQGYYLSRPVNLVDIKALLLDADAR
ncbi:hypothetical protein GCM10022631_08870 [Deinococcus rubellus]|uniref:EAL domain-containing protein n=1 Tax=Deinococcus rubellus TaxID=1889240 RepID=UPI0031F13FCB